MLNRRIALVTGGGGGIGEATARRLAEDGFHVVVADIHLDACQRVAQSICEAGLSAEHTSLDVTSFTEFQRVAKQINENRGHISALVHAAMQVTYSPIEELEPETIERALTIGLTSAFWAVKAVLPSMHQAENPGIVLFSSPAATRGIAGSSVYAAAKGGISSLVWQLASELGPQGIRVNGLIPGSVPTPGASKVVDKAGYEARRKSSALGRLGTPEDIANGVSFLLSDQSAYVNGHLLNVDGRIL